MGSAVPSRVSLFLLHTQAGSGAYSGIPPAFRGGVHSFTPLTAIGSSRVYQVTRLRTDYVFCLESAGTGPEVLKVFRITGAAFSGVTKDQLMSASLFPHPLLVFSGNADVMSNLSYFLCVCAIAISHWLTGALSMFL